MGKAAEHLAWTEIERRLGPALLREGERTRPTYLGTLINLGTGRIEVPDSKSQEYAEKKNEVDETV